MSLRTSGTLRTWARSLPLISAAGDPSLLECEPEQRVLFEASATIIASLKTPDYFYDEASL
jgi:hypothetical protein